MNKLLAKLPPFALPFVTRSLRGGRGQRYLLWSLVLGLATIVCGLWFGLGSGPLAQSVRVGAKLELHESVQQDREFVVLTHDSDRHRLEQRTADHLHERGAFSVTRGDYSEVITVRDNGRVLLGNAARSANATTEQQLALRDQARALLELGPDVIPTNDFDWDRRESVATLERVLELGGIPQVRRYESPLGFGEALKIVGFIASILFAGCVTVFGPLLVGIAQAQEQHENTLTPLTGTGLKPRELVLGLAAGPSFVVAIFAVPQLLVFLACVAISGSFILALGLLAALAASALFVTFAAQLLGHLVGPKRTPGVVAVALLGLLGFSWLAGSAFASELDADTAGLAAVLPTLGLSVLSSSVFGGFTSAHVNTALLATIVWSVAALVFAGLILMVLERQLEGKQGSPLAFAGALLGALTCVVLINVALPSPEADGAPRLFVGIAGLCLPLSLLLMSRVPTHDNPMKLRRIPVPRLLLEFGGWAGLHVLAATVLVHSQTSFFEPVALVWLAWCVGVAGLMVIRAASLPTASTPGS